MLHKNKKFIRLINLFFIFFSLLIIVIILFLYNKSFELSYSYVYRYYYYVLIFLLIISFSSIFANSEKKIKIFLLTISIIFCLYFSEFLLIIFHNKFFSNIDLNHQRVEKAKSLNIFFDTRTKKELFTKLRKSNSEISLTVNTNDFFSSNNELFPLSGSISNKLIIHCNENGYYTYYQSDRFGFNNTDSIWESPKIDFLLVGDSFTQGACVNTSKGEGFSRNFENLTNKNVLNLGVGGSGLLSYYARIKEYVSDKKIDNAIIFMFEGDIYIDLPKEFKDPRLKKYLDINFTQNLKQKKNEVDLIIDNLILLELNSLNESNKKFENDNNIYNFLSFFKIQKLRSFIKKYYYTPLDKKVDKKNTKILLSNIRSLLKESNLYLVCINGIEKYQKSFFSSSLSKLNECSDITPIAKEFNYTVINIHEELFKHKKDATVYYPFGIWGHFNALGYEEVSKFIIRKYF